MSEPTPMILDVDTGTDDALALAYAVSHPAIDLVAATTVVGNVDVEKATRNTLAVLDWLGASAVPVHRGASRPLVRPHEDASEFHGVEGLGGAQLPPSRREVGPDRGPAAMIRLARQRPGELTLVCLGPLTNLAIALNVEPGIVDMLKAVVVMGGAFHVPGNVTPEAEFNIYVDPEAAAQVFAAPFHSLTIVGLDAAEKVNLTRQDWESAIDDKNVTSAAALFGEVGRLAFSDSRHGRFTLYDPLTVAVAIDPGLIRSEQAQVTIGTTGAERGRTRGTDPGPVHIAVDVDGSRATDDFRETVGLSRASS